MPLKKVTGFDFTTDRLLLRAVRKPGLLIMYQDMCPHCTAVKPILRRISKLPGIYIYMMECTPVNNMKVLESFGATAVPDIRFVNHRGKVTKTPYKGNHTELDLKKYILSHLKNKQKVI